MNVKKDRPASLTPSLLARKGDAAPSRLADGSSPRDVMALHEEIVARLASEIEHDGLEHGEDAFGRDALGPADDTSGDEPRFDFNDDARFAAPLDAADAAMPVDETAIETDAPSSAPVDVSPDSQPDAQYEDDTHFDYEDDVPVAPSESDAPDVLSGRGFAELRPGDLRDPPPVVTGVPVTAPVMAPKAVPAPFVTLRSADPPARPVLRAQKPGRGVVASLPVAFAVMVAIAIGGGVGLWFAHSMAPSRTDASAPAATDATASPAPASPAVVADAPAPLSVPPKSDVAVAPIGTPAPPALRESASVPKAVEAPVTPAPAAAVTGAYGIQLMASPHQSEAAQAWDRLAAKHASLGKLPHEVVRADLGAKGVFYRLRAGAFETRAQAKAACDTLTAAKQACIVIKR